MEDRSSICHGHYQWLWHWRNVSRCLVSGVVLISCHYTLPVRRSMLPDVIEESELHYGVRREELFYAYFVFFTKFGAGITLGISNAILA